MSLIDSPRESWRSAGLATTGPPAELGHPPASNGRRVRVEGRSNSSATLFSTRVLAPCRSALSAERAVEQGPRLVGAKLVPVRKWRVTPAS